MKPINTSTFDFSTLIREKFVYVDKTCQIYELARPGTDHIYFFPRPRRFGKSLLVSTLDAPDALDSPTAALLYQGGYLTIDRRISDRMLYLKIPNREVRQSLETGYMSRLLGKDFEIDAMQDHRQRRTYG